MPSHFSTIGLPLESGDDFLALANRVANDTQPIDVPGGQYLRWVEDCGVELWLQVDHDHELLGMVPHFSGQARVRARLTSSIHRPNDTPLDGAFYGWADPSDDNSDSEAGTYPFVFDLPDYRCHAQLESHRVVSVQIAAFTHEIAMFRSVEEFDASQVGEAKFASQSFIPAGLFSPDGKPTEPPEAYAIFTGHILQTAKKQNPLSGTSFFWALVESLGGTFDVLIAPELVKEEPQVGGVLTGSFWLSGRIVE